MPGTTTTLTDTDLSNHYGFRAASLGDRLWVDSNGDGIQNDGATGISGQTVTLIGGGADGLISTAGDNTSATTTTGANGIYGFTGLTPGVQYQVQFTKPAGSTYTTQDVSGNSLDSTDSDVNASGLSQIVTLAAGQSNLTIDAGVVIPASIGLQKTILPVADCPTGPIGAAVVDTDQNGTPDSGINLGNLTKYLFVFGNGSVDANWQGASKGFAGDMVIDGIQATERSSGTVPFAGSIYTNDSTLGAWQGIVNQSFAQSTGVTGQTALVSGLESDLTYAFKQINGLTATAGYTSVAATALNGLNTLDGINQTYVINVTSGFQIASQIRITGDAGDVFVLRWDTDANAANGYQGQVKFQSGGAIVPLGGLTAANFVHVAGDINASGGGSTPAELPQGPRLNDGSGALVSGAQDFSGGGFFTGYWLTTGAPTTLDPTSGMYIGNTAPLSNAIFVGGWYSLTNKFSMTSGTSGVHVCIGANELQFDPTKVGADVQTATVGQDLVYTYKVSNNSAGVLATPSVKDDNGTPSNAADDFFPAAVLGSNGKNYGDTNANGLFDAGESWYFRKAVPAATAGLLTNVATATSGTAIATDSATVNIQTTTIGDRVWNDSNNNGLQDNNETGVAGVKVTLLNTVTSDTEIAVTNASGIYQFNVGAGSYQLIFDKSNVAAAKAWTTPDANSNNSDAIDSDVNVTTGKTAVFTVAAGSANINFDAGITPIVIDLNGDGIRTVSRADAIGTFDLLGNGSAIKSGWLSSGDGFLAVDKNGNGKIDDIGELFGGSAKGAGFARLAAFDSNHDGVVDARDADFGSLRIWRDANGNHQTDDGELMTLAQAGVAALKVGHTDLPMFDAQGNLHLERSSATMADGHSVDMTDVYFNVARSDLAAAGVSAPTLGELLGNDRSLDNLLGSSVAAPHSVAQPEHAGADVDMGDMLRRLAAVLRDDHVAASA